MRKSDSILSDIITLAVMTALLLIMSGCSGQNITTTDDPLTSSEVVFDRSAVKSERGSSNNYVPPEISVYNEKQQTSETMSALYSSEAGAEISRKIGSGNVTQEITQSDIDNKKSDRSAVDDGDFLSGTSEMMQLSLERAEVKSGDTVTVNLSVRNNPGIASLSADVMFDKDNLRLTGIKYNNEMTRSAACVPYNEKADPPCISLVSGAENITGDGVIASLSFKAVGTPGEYPVLLVCENDNVYNIDEQNIEFEVVNGLITIN